MKFHRHQIVGLLLLLLGLPFLAWGNWPSNQSNLVKLEFSPAELVLPQDTRSKDTPSAPSQGREVVLKGPAFFRLGDEVTLRLSLVASNASTSGELKDIYATHNLVARVWMELDGAVLSPEGEVLTPLRPGTPAVVTWKVRSLSPGIKDGVLWLHLKFVPLQVENGEGASIEKLLAAPNFQLRVGSFLGMAGLPARVIGGLMVTIGLVLLFEPFLSAIITNLFKKDNTSEESTEN